MDPPRARLPRAGRPLQRNTHVLLPDDFSPTIGAPDLRQSQAMRILPLPLAIMRSDIERALDELSSQEAGMRFQGLAVILGKMRWPELIAHPRKRDLGLDAYAPPTETPEKTGKGLAASITPTFKKLSADAKTAKENYPDLKKLLFVTASRVGKPTQKTWEHTMQAEHGLQLIIIEREEIITSLMMPHNASLLTSQLYLPIEREPHVTEFAAKTQRAAAAVTTAWARKTAGHPLLQLILAPIAPNGTESTDQLAIEQIDGLLSHTSRLVLEGPAGCGKTTTLIQMGAALFRRELSR